jgi:hypothetical protein
MSKKIISKNLILVGSMSALALLISVPCLAASATSTYSRNRTGIFARTNMAPTVSGSVTGISGNIIYLTGTNGTNYTVDATSAKLRKAGTTIAISGILGGDSLSVRGTLTGTNVVATSIMDGVSTAGANGQAWSANRANFSGGTITALNNPSFTMQTGTTTVTVNTNSSTIFKNADAAASFANLAVGQRVYVNGVKDSSNYIAAASSVNVIVAKNTADIVNPVVKKTVKSNVKTIVKPVVKKVVKTKAKIVTKAKTTNKTVKKSAVKIVKKIIKKK